MAYKRSSKEFGEREYGEVRVTPINLEVNGELRRRQDNTDRTADTMSP